MPANLPPQYYEAERRLRLAITPQEKIIIIRDMLGIMPHHKGTDKLQADLRAKIAKLNKEMQKKQATSRYTYHIEKEGVAQCVLIGLPNAGKSQLLRVLTNATPTVASYPFTTNNPIVGMMMYENIQIQLVDTPAVNHEFMDKWLGNIVVSADLLLLVVDLSNTLVMDEMGLITNRLEKSRIKIETSASSDRNPVSDSVPPRLSERGRNPVAAERGGTGSAVTDIGYLYKKALIVGNKKDLQEVRPQNAAKNLTHLRSHLLNKQLGPEIPVVAVSAKRKKGLQELKNQIYNSLNIIRIYSKAPSEKPDLSEPIVLSKGSTVIDAARVIHKDFIGKLRYARLWGSNKFDGQRVERNYLLKDGDIVEFHI